MNFRVLSDRAPVERVDQVEQVQPVAPVEPVAAAPVAPLPAPAESKMDIVPLPAPVAAPVVAPQALVPQAPEAPAPQAPAAPAQGFPLKVTLHNGLIKMDITVDTQEQFQSVMATLMSGNNPWGAAPQPAEQPRARARPAPRAKVSRAKKPAQALGTSFFHFLALDARCLEIHSLSMHLFNMHPFNMHLFNMHPTYGSFAFLRFSSVPPREHHG